MTTDLLGAWHPVGFRVTGIEPVADAASSVATLCVERVDVAGSQCLPVPASWIRPLQEALAAAIATQAVYWVGCAPAEGWGFPATYDDAAVQRLLHAVVSGKTASPGA
jgi:hypothetical protein